MSDKKIFQDQSEMNVIFVHSSLDDAGLSVYAFRVYCHISRMIDCGYTKFLSIPQMAHLCKVSRTSFRHATKELVRRQFIEVIRSPGKASTNSYKLTHSSAWTPAVFSEKPKSKRRKIKPRLALAVFRRDKFICQICSMPAGDLTCDHIIPIAKGGVNHIDNLQTACLKCNMKKGAR